MKKFYALMLVASIGSNVFAGFEETAKGLLTFDNAKKGVALSGAAVFVLGQNSIEDREMTRFVAYKTGTSSRDLANVTTVSSALIASSYAFDNKNTAKGLFKLGCRVPVLAASCAIAETNTTADLLKKIPFVGARFECPRNITARNSLTRNSSTSVELPCKGVCPECRMTKSLIGFGIFAATCPVIEMLNKRFGTNI